MKLLVEQFDLRAQLIHAPGVGVAQQHIQRPLPAFLHFAVIVGDCLSLGAAEINARLCRNLCGFGRVDFAGQGKNVLFLRAGDLAKGAGSNLDQCALGSCEVLRGLQLLAQGVQITRGLVLNGCGRSCGRCLLRDPDRR